MNERIKELEDQCWEDIGENEYYFNRDKFAELIIQKCADVAKYHTPDTKECEYTWLVHNKIKEHFGVKR